MRASFPRIRVGGAPGLLLRQRKNRTRFRILYERIEGRQQQTYGIRERCFYVSYGIAQFLRMNVILTRTFTTEHEDTVTGYVLGGPNYFRKVSLEHHNFDLICMIACMNI